MKNMHPSYLIGKQVKRFLHKKFSTNYWTAVTEFKTTLYFKLRYRNTKKKSTSYVRSFVKTLT